MRVVRQLKVSEPLFVAADAAVAVVDFQID